MKFPYLLRKNQFLPIVDVALSYKDRLIRLGALVDSGATFSLFRSEVADYLKVPLEKGKKLYLSGVGGRILGYLHTLPIQIGRITFDCKIVFSRQFRVSTNILGRNNFFLPFKISFLEYKRYLEIKKTKPCWGRSLP